MHIYFILKNSIIKPKVWFAGGEQINAFLGVKKITQKSLETKTKVDKDNKRTIQPFLGVNRPKRIKESFRRGSVP
jgi:hypothetical protein